MKSIQEQTPREIDTELARLDGIRFDAFLRVAQARKDILLYGENERRTARLVEAEAKLAEAKLAMEPGNNEFARRGGWHRYFVVAGGHVHRGMHCSTCHPTTRFGWLPELSGCDELDMVAAHGDGACAVCFPEVQDHPAFLAARAARLAAEAAQAGSVCQASGTYLGGRRYVKCPQCGRGVYVTPRGNIRKHDRREPKG